MSDASRETEAVSGDAEQDTDDEDALYVLFRGSSVVMLGLVIELALRLFGKVLVARVLGAVDFGAVTLGMTMAGVTATIVTVGMNTGIGRYLPRSDEAEYRRGVLVSGFQVALPIALLAGGAIVLSADLIARRAFHAPESAPVFRAAGVAVPLAAVLKLGVGAVQGRKLTRPKVLIQNVALPSTRFVLFAAAVLLGFQAAGVAWAFALSYAISAAIAVYFLAKHTALFERADPRALHGELLSFSVPVMVRNIMTMVLVHIDTFLLGILAAVAAVGIYGAVYPLAMLVTLAHKAMDFLYLPIVSELDADTRRDDIARLYRVVAKWLLIATVPLFAGLVVFPRLAITLTYGAEYASGATALRVLAAGFFVHTVVGVNGGTLEAIGSTRAVMVASLIVAVANVGLNLLLIPRYSLLGAAAATTAAYTLLNALYTAWLYRETGLFPFNRHFRQTGAAGAVLIAGLAGAKAVLGASFVTAVLLGGAFTVCYALAALRFGVGDEDLRLLDNVEQEFGVDLSAVKRTVRAVAG